MPEVIASTWVCIRDRRLLVVRTVGKAAFFIPGGTPEPGETLAETAAREVAEETGIRLRASDLVPYAEIIAPAYGRPGLTVRLVCFTAPSDETPAPANEIEEVAWFTAADADRCAPAIQQLIARLAGSGQLAPG